MQPTISIPQHWAYPRFALDQRTEQGTILADELYIIRTGVETNFAKSFLLAASLVQDFSKPLIIVANAGDENTVFCNLYDAVSKSRIEREWNKNADWATIIQLTPKPLITYWGEKHD